jgi:type I restriction enzyme S subunit
MNNLFRLGDFIELEKGLTYKGEFLAETSETGLLGLDSFIPGGGYKRNSEKPYSGPFKQKQAVNPGDVVLCLTDVSQDGSVLGSPLRVPMDLAGYKNLIMSHHIAKVVFKSEDLLPGYLYNIFRVPYFRERVAYGDTGTTVRALPFEVVYEQQVPIPDISVQKAIAELIEAVDEKIEPSNARQIAEYRAKLIPKLILEL